MWSTYLRDTPKGSTAPSRNFVVKCWASSSERWVLSPLAKRRMRCAPFFALASSAECAAICWQIKLPAPMMPRIVSSKVVDVRLSPISSWYGTKYLVSGSFQVVFHSIFLPCAGYLVYLFEKNEGKGRTEGS